MEAFYFLVTAAAAGFTGWQVWQGHRKRLEGRAAVRLELQPEYSLRGENGQFIAGSSEHRLRVYAYNKGGAAVEVVKGVVKDLDRSAVCSFLPGMLVDESPSTIPATLNGHSHLEWLLDMKKLREHFAKQQIHRKGTTRTFFGNVSVILSLGNDTQVHSEAINIGSIKRASMYVYGDPPIPPREPYGKTPEV
jgi:hypothetical protein